MLEKFVPVAFCLVLLGLMASSFSITESQPSRPGQQSCYRSLAGNGWLCAWEPSPGEKCWRTSSDSSCTRASSGAPAQRVSATRAEQVIGSN
jgi:hypothetical protein